MSLIVYKVIFKGQTTNEIPHLTLTFTELSLNNPIKISSNYINILNKLSQKSNNIINFQNIKEVIRIGDISSDLVINYYIVILYIKKSDKSKNGLLIGNAKKIGDILLGIWPFTKKTKKITSEEINSSFNKLIKSTEKYNKICIVYS